MTLKKNQKLATFNCDRQQWEAFLAKAAENGTSGAELLKWFTRSYISGDIDPRQHVGEGEAERLADVLDQRLTHYLSPIVERLEAVEEGLKKSSQKAVVHYLPR